MCETLGDSTQFSSADDAAVITDVNFDELCALGVQASPESDSHPKQATKFAHNILG